VKLQDVTFQVAVWALAVIVGWVGVQLNSIADNVSDLNKNVAVVIEKVENHERRMLKQESVGETHSNRIRELELRNRTSGG